jgi:LmeA-like phospholipid-binding
MSSDPNQRDEPAPPTVRMPVQPAGQNPPGREPATQPAPQWQPPPQKTPPPPPSAPPQKPQPQWEPTVREPAHDPTIQQPAQGRAAQDPLPPTQYAQEPVRQPPRMAQWQPKDTPPAAAPPTPQWNPTPPVQQPPAGGQWGPPPAPPRLRRTGPRRTRRWVMVVFAVVVLLILLVIGDRVALAVTENAMASQFESNGLPVKPGVSIEGFPFLTQLAAKDFKKVNITANNVPAGPVTISTIHANIDGLHISSFSSSASATVDHINATAFISLGALAAAGGLGGTGITVTPDGTDKLKITAGIGGIASDTEEAQITQTGPQTISIKLLDTGSPVGSLLSSFGSFSFSLPKGVPASLRITGLTLNSQGLTLNASASNATFSKS